MERSAGGQGALQALCADLTRQSPFCRACDIWASIHQETMDRLVISAVNAQPTWHAAMQELRAKMTNPAIRKRPGGPPPSAGFTTRVCAGCGQEKKGHTTRQIWFKLPASAEYRPVCANCARWCNTQMTDSKKREIQHAIDAKGQDYEAAAQVLLEHISNRPGQRKKANE